MIDRLLVSGRDDNEALAVAETAMLQAADSLAVGNFELALTQQEEAMRALVEARNSLREILTGQMSAQQRQALSQLLQQLNQKLRRTPATSDRALADSIQQVAAEQLALGASVGNILRDRTLVTLSPETPDSAEQGSVPSEEIRDGDATLDERLANSLDEQLALLARLQDIGDSLSEQILESELVTRRLADSLAAIGELVDQLQDELLGNFEPNTQDNADELRELALLIETVSQSETVDRIPSIAELTASLAAMEQDLSAALADGPFPRFNSETDAVGKSTNIAGDLSDLFDLSDLASHLFARSQTVQEVLKLSTNSSESSASEVSESISNFLNENRLLETLQASDAFSESVTESAAANHEGGNSAIIAMADLARERAADYSDATLQLEAIYRQLVTPKLARLREIEEQASRLEQKLADEEEPTGEAHAEMRELELSIRAAGLENIADVLMNGDLADSEVIGGPGGRVHLAVNLLRERMQQMISRDIAADRDAPVPPQYRRLVDRYFQVLSGATFDADNAESNP